MLELIVAFAVGMIVMDLMWAFKLGIPQAYYAYYKYRKAIRQNPNLEQEQL